MATRKQRARKRKQASVSSLRKKADAVFSRFVRWSAMERDGKVRCVTCSARKPPEEMQAGHFVSRKHNATRFDTRNVGPQCPACNLFRGGEQYRFGQYIATTFGAGVPDELFSLARNTKQFTAEELVKLIHDWEAGIAESDS